MVTPPGIELLWQALKATLSRAMPRVSTIQSELAADEDCAHSEVPKCEAPGQTLRTRQLLLALWERCDGIARRGRRASPGNGSTVLMSLPYNLLCNAMQTKIAEY
jgi:hypothetical protein